MYDLLKRMYLHSPRVVQEAFARLPPEVKLGRKFRDESSLLRESEYWNSDQLSGLQSERLRGHLQQAFATVEFYRRWASRNLAGGQVDDPLAVLRSLPLVSKREMREHEAEFRSDNWSRFKAFYTTTGGTSGQPFGFWVDNSVYAREWAYVNHAWGWFGYRFGDRKVTLRGVPFKNKPGQTVAYNPNYNELLLSPFDMSEENLSKYVTHVNEFKPEFLHGYPSALIILGKYLMRTGHSIPPLKAVFGVSENIYPGQRELIESAYHAPFQCFYGQSERVVFAAQCGHSDEYHVFPQYGYVELVGDDGQVINRPGVIGEIVATGFLNSTMPFIRYRTGDYAEWASGECECGRHSPRLRTIRGRWIQEMLVGRNQEQISMTALNLHSRAFDNVEQFRFVQHEVGTAELLLVTNPSFERGQIPVILGELNQKVGQVLHLEVKVVPELKPSLSGKSVFLEQHIPGTRV